MRRVGSKHPSWKLERCSSNPSISSGRRSLDLEKQKPEAWAAERTISCRRPSTQTSKGPGQERSKELTSSTSSSSPYPQSSNWISSSSGPKLSSLILAVERGILIRAVHHSCGWALDRLIWGGCVWAHRGPAARRRPSSCAPHLGCTSGWRRLCCPEKVKGHICFLDRWYASREIRCSHARARVTDLVIS